MHSLSLKPEDHIALIAPGSICRHPSHPAITRDFLKKQYQLNAQFSNDTTQSLHPEQRAQIFLETLFNKDIKLLAQVRGGEGTADILPYVHRHYEDIKKLPAKILLGHSDFTALLIYFAQFYHWPVIHGPSLRQFALSAVDESSQQQTMDLLFGRLNQFNLELMPLNDAAKIDATIKAPLNGGNLSLVHISIKDIWEIDTKDKILFFEDCGEKAHKIIRTLKYFSRIGLFDTIQAVILGDFTCYPIGCDKEEQTQNQQAILKTLSSFAAHHPFPVLYTSRIGHGRVNLPLIYNTTYTLQLGVSAQLALNP